MWGQIIETDRYVNASALSGDTYNISLDGIASLSDLDNFEKIAFKINTTNPANAAISINGLEKLLIVDDSGNPLPAQTLPTGTDGVFKYRRKDKSMYYLGQYQVFGEAYDEILTAL